MCLHPDMDDAWTSEAVALSDGDDTPSEGHGAAWAEAAVQSSDEDAEAAEPAQIDAQDASFEATLPTDPWAMELCNRFPSRFHPKILRTAMQKRRRTHWL